MKSPRRSRQRQRKHSTKNPPSKQKFITGKVQKNPKGFAFIIAFEPGMEDTYVSYEEASSLMNNDKVRFTQIKERGRIRATNIKVLERAQNQCIGQVHREDSYFILETEDSVFLFDKDMRLKDLIGDWVLADIVHFPNEEHIGVVELNEVLGPEILPAHDLLFAKVKFNLPQQFPLQALTQAKKAIDQHALAIKQLNHRKDLTEMPFVTIDGEDAKDFDDAVCVLPTNEEGAAFILYVAIADVSFFVEEGSDLDLAAKERSTSIYFPGHCIPMLPELLSNDLCSLRPKEPRLALTAEMHFDLEGKCLFSHFYESLIRTKARLTYNQVQKYFDREETTKAELEDLSAALKMLRQLYKRLLERRVKRGSLDFDLPELEFELDAKGTPVRVVKRERLESHRLIEEFMISANSEVAKALTHSQIDTLHRVHDTPKASALDEINQLLKALGVTHRIKSLSPQALSQLLSMTEHHPAKYPIHHALLRAQKQACYDPEARGHFGLALTHYAHFTSPIRRYPDLVVHRSLKRLINNDNSSDKLKDETHFSSLGIHTSMRERRAIEAERFLVRRKECWYLKPRLGECFHGSITGLTSNGVFVQLDSLGIEGFVPIDAWPGLWFFDEKNLKLTQKRSNQEIHLGDRLEVQVARVSVEAGQIEFTRI